MRIRGWVVIPVALGLAAASIPAQQAIPEAHGTTLAGNSVGLPDAVHGKVGVLVVGFSKSSQGQVAAWGRRLSADFNQSSSVVYFEVPILAGAPRILRGMIVRQMGSTVPDAQRPHFLPLMENEAGWRAVTHYDQSDDAYVLLLDGTGTIYWQTHGNATDAEYNMLRKQLQSLMEQTGVR